MTRNWAVGSWSVLLAAALAMLCTACGRPTRRAKPRGKRPVAYWKFDRKRGSRVKDSSGMGHHGRIFGAERIEGKQGRALSFAKPNSRVVIPSSKGLQLGRAFSVECWIRPQDISDGSRVILSKNDEYTLRIDNPEEGSKLSFFVHAGTPAATWEPRVSSQDRPKLNVWQHVLASWSGSKLRVYVDGRLVGEQRRGGRAYPTPYPLIIGNWEYPTCHGIHFGGAIDELRIYNYARKPDEAPTR